LRLAPRCLPRYRIARAKPALERRLIHDDA
jgi:hypothetical protein